MYRRAPIKVTIDGDLVEDRQGVVHVCFAHRDCWRDWWHHSQPMGVTVYQSGNRARFVPMLPGFLRWKKPWGTS